MAMGVAVARPGGGSLRRFVRARSTIAFLMTLPLIVIIGGLVVWPAGYAMHLATLNRRMTGFLRAAHGVCESHNDVASTSLIEVWIDEAERRSWFLFESTRAPR